MRKRYGFQLDCYTHGLSRTISTQYISDSGRKDAKTFLNLSNFRYFLKFTIWLFSAYFVINLALSKSVWIMCQTVYWYYYYWYYRFNSLCDLIDWKTLIFLSWWCKNVGFWIRNWKPLLLLFLFLLVLDDAYSRQQFSWFFYYDWSFYPVLGCWPNH